MLLKKTSFYQTRKFRTILATILIIWLLVCFIWSVVKDFQARRFQQRLEAFISPFKVDNYVLKLNSINLEEQKVMGTLALEVGVSPDIYKDFPKVPRKLPQYYFGALEYNDLSSYFGFIPYSEKFIKIFEFFVPSYKKKSIKEPSLGKPSPDTIDVRLNTVGNPELYPFDKYLIAGHVTCITYEEQNPPKIINDTKYGESLSIKNSIPGVFVRLPRETEYKRMVEFNNHKNRFALMIERSFYLRFMTILLGIIALVSAIYIGFIIALDKILMHAMGYVLGLWGIRSILIGGVKIFPSYFEYAVLLMYLILFTGVIFRRIKGNG
jgi:hypothetical protein